MAKVILDTAVFIEIFNKNAQKFEFINDIILFENIITTFITEAEVIISANNKDHKKRWKDLQFIPNLKLISHTIKPVKIPFK